MLNSEKERDWVSEDTVELGQSTRNCSLDFLLGKTVTLIIKPIFK